MTDIQIPADTVAVELPSFDPDAVFKQAQAQVDSIKSQIERQQEIKLAADAKIRDLRSALAKTERIVSAMTPRARIVKTAEDKPKAPAAKKPAAAKKTAA